MDDKVIRDSEVSESLRTHSKINWTFAGEYSGLIIMVQKRRISEDM